MEIQNNGLKIPHNVHNRLGQDCPNKWWRPQKETPTIAGGSGRCRDHLDTNIGQQHVKQSDRMWARFAFSDIKVAWRDQLQKLRHASQAQLKLLLAAVNRCLPLRESPDHDRTPAIA
jgi:hypothetical protein